MGSRTTSALPRMVPHWTICEAVWEVQQTGQGKPGRWRTSKGGQAWSHSLPLHVLGTIPRSSYRGHWRGGGPRDKVLERGSRLGDPKTPSRATARALWGADPSPWEMPKATPMSSVATYQAPSPALPVGLYGASSEPFLFFDRDLKTGLSSSDSSEG